MLKIGFLIFAVLVIIICLEFSFPGFVNNYWSPIVSTMLTSLLAWLAYLSYQRDEPKPQLILAFSKVNTQSCLFVQIINR